MRSFTAGVLVSLLFLSAPAGAADLPEISESGTLRVLVVEGSPAFYGLAEGEAPGFDREILDGFARLQRVTISTGQIPSWAELVPALLAGRGDVIAGGMTVTPARAKLVNFSLEVFPTRAVVISRRPMPVVETIEQLRATRVGTIRGSSMAEGLATAGVRDFEDVPSGGTPEALRGGKVAAAVVGIEDALVYQKADPEIQVGLFLGDPASLAYGVRKDSPQLLAALNDYLGNLRRTPTWNRLVLKYFGVQAPEILKRARGQ